LAATTSLTLDSKESGVDAELDQEVPMAEVGGVDRPHRNAALGTKPISTIEREELKRKLDGDDELKLVMALNRWAYDAKHIPGSLHFDTPDALYSALDTGDEIVVYCSQNDCLSSVAMYRDLVGRGYHNVRRYSGGLMDWEDAGLPLEGAFVDSESRD